MSSRDNFDAVWNVKNPPHGTDVFSFRATCAAKEPLLQCFCKITPNPQPVLQQHGHIFKESWSSVVLRVALTVIQNTVASCQRLFFKNGRFKREVGFVPKYSYKLSCSLFPRSQTFGWFSGWLLPSARPELVVSVKTQSSCRAAPIVQFHINISVFMLRKKIHKVNLY